MKTLASILLSAVAALAAAQTAAPAKTATPAPAAKTSAAPAAKAVHASKQVDINTASAEELKALPGVGDAYAQKIVEGRPYKGRNELLDRKIVPADVYAKIRLQIKARQPKVAKTSSAAKSASAAKPAPAVK